MRLVGLLAGLRWPFSLSLPAPRAPRACSAPPSPPPTPGSRRASAPGARSGCSPPPSTTASSPTPTRSGSAARSTGTASCAPTGGRTSSRPGAPSPTPTAACPAIPTARPARPPRPTASSGAPATTRCSPSSAARATATPPATSPTRRSTPRRRTAALDQRQSACDLRFGTSTGALGLRKFPNPRFDAAAWDRIGGWAGYAAFLSNDPASPDSRLNRLWDGSVEPPFRIGMACGACHIAYDPLKPPADPKAPAWENIDALVGNQYSRISNLLGSGLSPHRLEWQLIARARPGIVDTSALPMDFVSNPGTMNAIINFARRPLHRGRRAEVAQGLGLRRRRRPRRPAGASRAARANAGSAASRPRWCPRPEGRRGFDRLQRGDPAGLLQHRLLRRAVLDQPPDRPARRRPRAAQLRPDPVRHRPVPARLRLVPRDRGPARRHPRLLPDRAPDRPLARPRPRLAARPRGRRSTPSSSTARSSRAGRSSPRTAPAAIRASPAPTITPTSLATDPADPTLRLDWLGNDEIVAGLRDRHLSGAVAALQPHAEPGLGRVRLADRAEPPGRPAAARGDERRRPRLLPQHLAAQRLGARALHAQQRHRPRDSAASRETAGARLLRLALRRRRRQAARRPARLPAPSIPSVEGRYALYEASMQELLNPDAPDPQDVRARQRHRHRHRAAAEPARPRPRARR